MVCFFWFFACFWPLLPGIRPVYVEVFCLFNELCLLIKKKKKMLSDACGGFIVVDMDTDERCHLKWARL